MAGGCIRVVNQLLHVNQLFAIIFGLNGLDGNHAEKYSRKNNMMMLVLLCPADDAYEDEVDAHNSSITTQPDDDYEVLK